MLIQPIVPASGATKQRKEARLRTKKKRTKSPKLPSRHKSLKSFSQRRREKADDESCGSENTPVTRNTAPAVTYNFNPICVPGSRSLSLSSERSQRQEYESDEGQITLKSDDLSLAAQTVPADTRRSLSFIESTGFDSVGTQDTKPLVDCMDHGNRMNDVTLLGRDGVRIRATKFLLASRSPALQKLLYYDSEKEEVFIGCFGYTAIQAMKDYCQDGSISSKSLLLQKSAKSARGLVELAKLAKMYDMEALYGEADSILNQLITVSPWFVTASYDEAVGSHTQLLEQFLVEFINGRCPDLFTETNALKHLRLERFMKLLENLDCDHNQKSQIFDRWIELKGGSDTNIGAVKEAILSKLSSTPKTQEVDKAVVASTKPCESFSPAAVMPQENDEELERIDIYDMQPLCTTLDRTESRASTTSSGDDLSGIDLDSEFDMSSQDLSMDLFSQDSGDGPPGDSSKHRRRRRNKKKGASRRLSKSNSDILCYQLSTGGEVTVLESTHLIPLV